MNSATSSKPLSLVTALAIVVAASSFALVTAQTQSLGTNAKDRASQQRPRTTEPRTVAKTGSGMPGEAAPQTDAAGVAQSGRAGVDGEDSEVVSIYTNFFTTYRLGPEDVISVSVFGQERYSRNAITIPPSGKISLALIPGGLFINGKTTEEVEELIKKKYDEYIIDPQVSVSLDKAASYRYSILGDVGQPGVRLMSHRMTVTEAIAESGGVLTTGDRSKVVVLRRQKDGTMSQIPVNVAAIYKGKAADSTFLLPGDQILVPGNRMKSIQKILGLVQTASFARIFTGL
jgi:polysaccharide export outer membrane protein